jgi:hypothetical protein
LRHGIVWAAAAFRLQLALSRIVLGLNPETRMSGPSDFLKEAARLRDMARRARRMAGQLAIEADRLRVEDYAQELEAEATNWERRAAAGKTKE